MLKKALFVVAVGSLLAGCWIAWDHFLGKIDRDAFLNRTYLVTVVWFAAATTWAYLKDDRQPQ